MKHPLTDPSRWRRWPSILMHDAICALAILAVTGIPLAMGIQAERLKLRQASERAIAMELIDGELELLHAGLWRTLGEGTHAAYNMHGEAAARLGGDFVLTVADDRLTLTWNPGNGRPPRAGSVPLPGGRP